MSVSNKKTSEEAARERFKPQIAEIAKKDLSNYYPKDEHFTKQKTYLRKNKEGEFAFTADWLNINVGGFKMVLHKGVAVSKSDLAKFSKEAKEHYLTPKKEAVKEKTPKKEAVK